MLNTRSLFFMICICLLTPHLVSASNREGPDETSSLREDGEKHFSLGNFFNANDEFFVADTMPLIARVTNFINPKALKEALELYGIEQETDTLSINDLSQLCHSILKNDAQTMLFKWVPFLGINFWISCTIDLLNRSPAYMIYDGLATTQQLANLGILMHHYACTYGNWATLKKRKVD